MIDFLIWVPTSIGLVFVGLFTIYLIARIASLAVRKTFYEQPKNGAEKG